MEVARDFLTVTSDLPYDIEQVPKSQYLIHKKSLFIKMAKIKKKVFLKAAGKLIKQIQKKVPSVSLNACKVAFGIRKAGRKVGRKKTYGASLKLKKILNGIKVSKVRKTKSRTRKNGFKQIGGLRGVYGRGRRPNIDINEIMGNDKSLNEFGSFFQQ